MITLVLIAVGSCLALSGSITYLSWRDSIFSSFTSYIIVFLELMLLTSAITFTLFASIFLLGRMIS